MIGMWYFISSACSWGVVHKHVCVFFRCPQNDESVTGGDSASEVSISCSSTDDTASVGPSSSSPEGSQGLGCSWSPEEGIQSGATVTAGLDGGVSGGGGGEAEEAKDRITEVPRRSSLLRNSIRSLSPLRRHSWGPGKNNGGDTEMNQRRWAKEFRLYCGWSWTDWLWDRSVALCPGCWC